PKSDGPAEFRRSTRRRDCCGRVRRRTCAQTSRGRSALPLAARRAHTAAMKLRLCWLVARVFQLALAAVVLGAACRGASPPAKLRPSLLEDLASTPSFRSPARWEFHPREMSEPLVTRVVTETGTLLVAAEGERWWIDRGQDTATVADELAPEP